jgi:hypothetical protein
VDGCVVLGRREEVGPLAPVVVAVVVVGIDAVRSRAI